MNSKGNVLFLILIAVALFAALAYAVTKSSGGLGKNSDSERVEIRASQIMQYAASLRLATQRMVLSGIDPTTITLHKAADYTACTTETNCIFGASGKAIEIKLSPDSSDAYASNLWHYLQISDNATVLNVGTTAPDLVVQRQLTFNERGRAICQAINKALGITGIPVTDGSNYTLAAFGGAAPAQPAACTQEFTNHYAFYFTLYAR